MSRNEIVYFAVMLFFALAALTEWKRRRHQTALRLKRGLHSYVSNDIAGSYRECDPASV